MKKRPEPAKWATALPPVSRAVENTIRVTWGLRPRLYAYACFAGSNANGD
jgi:hypothetical protein